MSTRRRTTRALATLAALSIAASAGAQGAATDLFTDVGSKQTAKDFEPAPDTIDTSFGTLQFTGGAFPTDDSVQAICVSPNLADRGFFVVFRFYGPLEGYIEKTWVLDDFEALD